MSTPRQLFLYTFDTVPGNVVSRITVPEGKYLRLATLFASVTSVAAVANRSFQIAFYNPSSTQIFDLQSGTYQVVFENKTYCAAIGTQARTSASATSFYLPLPEVTLSAGMYVTIGLLNGDATDTLSISAVFEDRPYP